MSVHGFWFIRLVLSLLVLFLSALSGLSQSPIITTYAGPPLPVSGAHALTQAVDGPSSVVPDGAGGFYVVSRNQNRVYRVTADGVISIIAGSGGYGFSGDSGPATSAQLRFPRSIAVDAAGSLYIADTNNHRIRKVTPDGVIRTVAGTGNAGFTGDGGQRPSARLSGPRGVGVDAAGSLYVADTNNHRIRKVTASGVINTVAGTGITGSSGDGGPATSSQLNLPSGVTVDAAGSLYIADTNNSKIRKVTAGGVINTVAGTGIPEFSGDGGPATSAQLNLPLGIVVDAAGELYIADTNNSSIRKVTTGGVISTVAGTGTAGFSGDGGPATSGQLSSPSGVLVDASGSMYVADTNNNRVRKITPDGVISTVAGTGTGGFSGDGGPATSAQLRLPSGVVVDAGGNIYVADTNNHRIRKVTPDGVISTFAGTGTTGSSGDGGPATSARLSSPRGVALDGAGNLYVADTNNHRIRKVTPDGVISSVAGTGIAGFNGDEGQATSAQLSSPWAVAVDAAGNLYIADTNNHRVRKMTPDGLIHTAAGTGIAGLSGDSSQATSAQLNVPRGYCRGFGRQPLHRRHQ